MEDCLGDDKAARQVAPELGPPSAMVTGLHLDDLRHTIACRRRWAGVDIYTVSKWLRHASVVIRERYGHLSRDDLKAAVERRPHTPSSCR